MIKTLLTCLITICFNLAGHMQPVKLIRYKDYLFTHLSIQKNEAYSTRTSPGTKSKYYRFDLYQATEDTATGRPLIIWMHGGGFKFGSKKAKGIRLWSKSFARRGYLCAAVNYRLSKKNPLRQFSALIQGCYHAVQDVSEAVEFFKKNAAAYRIDTNRVILAGNSAGGIIALQTAYSGHKGFSALMTDVDTGMHSGLLKPPNNIAAVINFWGALFDTSWLQNAKVPIVSVHGQKDRIVPYKHNGSLYGSFSIHQKADSINIPNRLKTYERYGHELQKHFIPILRSGATKRRWIEAGNFAASFIYDEVLN